MDFIILVSIYSVLIFVLVFGFSRLRTNTSKTTDKQEKSHISVVVAVRNDSDNITTLLKDFKKIEYPSDKWEFIIVDDSDVPLSTPNTIRSPAPGKKTAITTGVFAARGDIIVTTDADCRVSPLWLKEINNAFQSDEVKMVIGGVRIAEDDSFFSKLQSLEFVSVAATGAATLGLGIPTMCNGANLAYRRDAFYEVGGYEGNEHIASGDDEFLMNKINKKWKDGIRYLYSQDALVTTSALPNLRSFVDQRLRWAGKWKHNISWTTRVFAMVIWLIHLGFIAQFLSILGLFIPIGFSLNIFLSCFGAKILLDALFLMPAAIFYRVKWRWISFIALQFVYSPYVVLTGWTSVFFSPTWKGRAVEAQL